MDGPLRWDTGCNLGIGDMILATMGKESFLGWSLDRFSIQSAFR